MNDLPEFIGPYHIGAVIIETDNSIIYESYHPQRCEKLAIKCIKKQGVNPQIIEDECTIMLEISHNAIMHPVSDGIFNLDLYRCIVMPLATGGDLFEYVVANGPMNENSASQVMHRALQAISYLHNLGIWHRDIKLENFLLMDDSVVDPNVVLADLGFAKHFTPGEYSTDFLGTPLYAAPEIHAKQPYNESVDMWSLGVTMYILLSAVPPFPTDDDYCQMTSIISCQYDFDDPVWDEVSDEAKDLISWMMKKNPEERIDPEEALNHPWFQAYFPERDKPRLTRTTAHALGIAGVYEEGEEFDDDSDFSIGY